MGIADRHDLRVALVILLQYSILTTAFYDTNWKQTYGQSQETVWASSDQQKTNQVTRKGCCEQSCMIGQFCNESVAAYSPRFQNEFTFMEVTSDEIGQTLVYNATTYPIPNQCRCPNVVYSLNSVKNDMEDGIKSTTVFAINSSTGGIILQKALRQNEMYSLVVKAENIVTGISSKTELTVARKVQPFESENEYSPIKYNGYEDVHYRQKRAVISGNDVSFTLTKLTNVSEFKVGSKIDFQLDIEVPADGEIDMLLELFAPDNDTTVMILCDIGVNADVGFTADNWPVTIVLDSKLNNLVTHPDRAILDFGVLHNTGGSAGNLTVTYSAVTVANNAETVDGNTYWVSAGAAFDTYLWIGQASFVADYDTTTTHQAVFSVNSPASVEAGSSHNIQVDMHLPYPHSTYTFKVFTPTDTPGTMSVCSMKYDSSDFGTNFGCGNDFTLISSVLTTDPVGPGNSIGAVNLGTLLNQVKQSNSYSASTRCDEVMSGVWPFMRGKQEVDRQNGSRSDNPLDDASKVIVSFAAHVYPTVATGSDATLAISLEVDTDILWVGNLSMSVIDRTSTPVDPIVSPVTTDLPVGNIATVGESFTITYKLSIPAPSQTGAGSSYVIEVLAPFTTEALFSVCSLEIVSVGRDLPCIKVEDLEPVFLSRSSDGGTLPDTARLDIGYVTNMQIYQGVGDDVIEIQAKLSPTEGKATVPSSHIVYFGVAVGSVSVVVHNETIDVQNGPQSIAVTNETAPSFTMDFKDLQSSVRINGVARVDLDMLTAQNITYPVMELEVLMPTDVSEPFIHICKVKVESKGKNLPCLTPEWSNKIAQYISIFDSDKYDRAKLELQRLCNTGEYSDTNEDRAIFSIYLKVMNLASLTDNDIKWISVGVMYSSTTLWLGQLQLTARDETGLQIAAPTGTIHHSFQRNSTAGSIDIGESARYSLLLKIPPNESLDLKVRATSSAMGLNICTVRVYAAGDNLPCIVDDLTTKTYTYHSDDGRASTTVDVGVFKNFNTDAFSVNNFFDADSIIMEVIVTGTTAGSYTFDLEAFVDTAQTVAIQYLGEPVIVSSSIYSQSYTEPVNITLSVGEFIKNDTIDSNMAIGEVKRMVGTLTVPEHVTYKIQAAVIIPSAYIGKLEILDAAFYSVGANLPCLDVEKAIPQLSSMGLVFNDTAIFDLGFTCNSPVKPGDTEANSIVIEVYVRALPNTYTAVGDTVQIAGSMTIFNDSPISVTGTILTITDTDSFVDKVESLDGVTNSSLITVDLTSNIPISPGENMTVPVTVTVPPKSQSRFYFDTQMPLNDSACLIIRDMRVIGSVGRNVLFMGPSLSKGLSFDPVYNSTLENGQQDYGLLDLGIITNTGLTYRLKSNQSDDNTFQLELDIQLADCADSEHGKSLFISIGNKLASVILVYEHAVQVNRDELELPDIVFTTIHNVLNSVTLIIDGIVYHSNTSTAEGRNTSVFIYLPAYHIAPTSLVSNSMPSRCAVNAVHPEVLEILCPSFYFSDILTFRASVSVNSTVELSQGFTAADSAANLEVGTDFNIRYNTYNLTDWYPYYVSSSQPIEYSVSAGIGTGCDTALGMQSGSIQNCQITGSSNSISDPTLGRLQGTSAWRPFIRDGDIAKDRYIQIYFGNVVKVTKIAVQQSGTVKAASIMVEHSLDGIAWFGREEISLGSSPSTLETKLIPGAKEEKYIRIYVWSTTVTDKPDVLLRFELYGCQISGSMTPTQICDTAPSTSSASDFYERSFVVGNSNQVFVCDRSLNINYDGHCQTSTDGDTWTALDENLASVIGKETVENYIFGYGQNHETILRSEDDGVTWQGVEAAELVKAKSSSAWINAINIKETIDNTLVQTLPTFYYTQGNWGGTYEGMFLSGQQRLKWTSTA